MIDQHPALPGDALTQPTTRGAPRSPELTFSDDQYESFTYNKWFERHSGMSLDEAIARGLATRDHSTEWKATRSTDGSWHLSHENTP